MYNLTIKNWNYEQYLLSNLIYQLFGNLIQHFLFAGSNLYIFIFLMQDFFLS